MDKTKHDAHVTTHTDATTGHDGGSQAGKNPTHGPAADLVVKDLLSRLGIDESGGVATANLMKAGHGHGKPISDSEIEALNPHQLAAFEAAVKAAVDPKMVAAIKAAGGMIPFLKDMAANKSVGGFTDKMFVTMWKTSVDEAWLKDRFRAVSSGMHEWIPSNQVEPVVEKAKKSPEGASWIDLQNLLRSPTPHVIFGPAHALPAKDGQGILLQGHVGALYLNGVMQTVKEAEFHDQLRAAFIAAKDIADAVSRLKSVMMLWMWAGTESLQPGLHPNLSDSVGKPVDEAQLVQNRPTVFKQMVDLFDGIVAQVEAAKTQDPHAPHPNSADGSTHDTGTHESKT